MSRWNQRWLFVRAVDSVTENSGPWLASVVECLSLMILFLRLYLFGWAYGSLATGGSRLRLLQLYLPHAQDVQPRKVIIRIGSLTVGELGPPIWVLWQTQWTKSWVS